MPRVPVKLVSWEEVVEWARGLSEKIKGDGYKPDLVVAVARGGFVPARLVCDFLDVTDLLSVQSQHWVEAARAAEKAILRHPYKIDAAGLRVLVVDDIVDTGETLRLARDFIEREWRPAEVRTAALQWISTVAKYKPDYYHMEVREWVWFQYPWTRLEDTTQFILRIFREDERARGRPLTEEELKNLFREWYGLDPAELGDYWQLALRHLEEKGLLARHDGAYKLAKPQP